MPPALVYRGPPRILAGCGGSPDRPFSYFLVSLLQQRCQLSAVSRRSRRQALFFLTDFHAPLGISSFDLLAKAPARGLTLPHFGARTTKWCGQG